MMFVAIFSGGLCSCEEGREHIAPAIRERDSVSMMISYGVNTLISDSGVIKYRIVSERWDVNTVRNPPRWTFIKGIFLEQFDEKFHVKAYIQADTAWYYDQQKLWELRGRVSMRNVNGLIFKSEELFWDGMKHELYSYKFSRLVTPERTLQGTYFRSDESMTHYTVSNSKGSFVKSDMDGSQVSSQQLSSDENVHKQGEVLQADTADVLPNVRPAVKAHAAKNKK
ncbi:LPS export ABC transporter periplasmic protein LptC [Xylanibacter muris]|uniref:LPS export ABC transporter periplasmic protein LptC n=1 Tax=Xylanibacter muris TaxID=2736290 RepID=A0ABX2AK88_9BACT|nr:LPS export ABC transporter periplasmic protein LptC [Xylanibacter muris]NPD91273.1 LPS export ABC transporter periplasmic protein LptC [Xylanibacter muris]